MLKGSENVPDKALSKMPLFRSGKNFKRTSIYDIWSYLKNEKTLPRTKDKLRLPITSNDVRKPMASIDSISQPPNDNLRQIHKR